MEQTTRRPRPVTRVALWFSGIGVLLVLGYTALSQFHLGKFGEPTDIGGGFVLLVGLIGVLTGVLLLIIAAATRRR